MAIQQVDLILVVAVIIFTAAAAVAVASDQPPRRRRQTWRYPAMVGATAAANIVLAVAAAKPARLTSIVEFGSALLLGYAVHRRARAADIRRPPPQGESPCDEWC